MSGGGLFSGRKYGLPSIEEATGAGLGYVSACILNMINNRAPYSGFHKHIIFTAVGYSLGLSLYTLAQRNSRRRALHVEDYINAHPEHFEELFVPDKKWKDVFEPWRPNR